MDNEQWAWDLGGSEEHGAERGADIDGLLERSSLGEAAAASFYKRAREAGEDASEVLDILARLDKEEEDTEAADGLRRGGTGNSGAPSAPPAIAPAMLATALRELRQSCAVHTNTDPQRLELIAIRARVAQGAQRVALIRTLMADMTLTVRRTSHTVFRSMQRLARYWIDTETLPPPAATPVVGTPWTSPGHESSEHEILDDTCLVFDRSLFHTDNDTRNNPGRHDSRPNGRLEVYWPSEIEVEHEMFLSQIRAFTYRVDLSPHTLTTPLHPDRPDHGSVPQYVVGLLWRVVDPESTLRWRHLSFTFLLEAVLDEWRAPLAKEVEQKGRIDGELRTRIAADGCWSRLGVQVDVQLCGQGHDGLTDRLDDGGLHFLLEAFNDRRRWFTPDLLYRQGWQAPAAVGAAPPTDTSPSTDLPYRPAGLEDRGFEDTRRGPRLLPPARPYATPHGGSFLSPRTPLFASSTESTGPIRRLP